MPTYDYRCRDCGHTIEIVHSILDDGPETCERCRGPLTRVLHPAGVIFKGSGFYTTDSRKPAGSSDAASSGSAGGGSTSGPSTSGTKATDSGGSGSSPAGGKGPSSSD